MVSSVLASTRSAGASMGDVPFRLRKGAEANCTEKGKVVPAATGGRSGYSAFQKPFGSGYRKSFFPLDQQLRFLAFDKHPISEQHHSTQRGSRRLELIS